MPLKANRTVIEWDANSGSSFILNRGDTIASSDVPDIILDNNPDAFEDLGDDLPQLDHDGDGEPGGSLPDDPPSLSGKNKADLLAIADDEGVQADDSMTKAEIVTAIEAARVADEIGDDAPPA